MSIQPDQIIHCRRRTITLIIQLDGRLVVRAPLRMTTAQIQAFIDQKAGWIGKKQREIHTRKPQFVPHLFELDERFWYMGLAYPLKITTRRRPLLVLEDGAFTLAELALPRARDVFISWYRHQAEQVLADRTAEIAARYGFSYKKIRITSARTRWGSCSTRGSISFPWRLVMTPVDVIDYVIVHELVHTVEHHHQAAFWQKVGMILPDYAARREWLAKNGGLFTL